ncbi:hypothetical protein M0802_011137 [Mischocyttarus mexicanus]|nr:hypothetical protein M0802_011137 [Mischocyttarus mexicanus]
MFPVLNSTLSTRVVQRLGDVNFDYSQIQWQGLWPRPDLLVAHFPSTPQLKPGTELPASSAAPVTLYQQQQKQPQHLKCLRHLRYDIFLR